MSYNAFERMLIRFGFTKTELDKMRALVFEHPATGATLIVPAGTPQQEVPHTNLVTARRTILVKGIASRREYAQAVARLKMREISPFALEPSQ